MGLARFGFVALGLAHGLGSQASTNAPARDSGSCSEKIDLKETTGGEFRVYGASIRLL